MYEIGKAPENASHPDHAVAGELARGFWASLPLLDRQLVRQLLVRARGLDPDGAEAKAIGDVMETEAFRIALGRIACGYDGGQIG